MSDTEMLIELIKKNLEVIAAHGELIKTLIENVLDLKNRVEGLEGRNERNRNY